MKLSQLKCFISICDNHSVTAAAASLHISQPSLSVTIKELEKEFGVSLFFHSKKKLILTDEGKYFLNKATDIVDRADALEEHMKGIGRHSEKIRIGAPPMAAVFLFPKLVMAFNERYPSIRIELVETGTHDLEEMLRMDKLDAAITNYPALSELYQYMPIIETELLGCVSKEHPLAGRKNVTMSMLKDERLILNNPTSMTTRQIQQAFKDENVEPNFFMYTHQLYLVIHFIQQYGLVSFLVDGFLKITDDVATFSLEKPIRFTYALIRRKDIYPSNDMAKFMRFCENYKVG